MGGRLGTRNCSMVLGIIEITPIRYSFREIHLVRTACVYVYVPTATARPTPRAVCCASLSPQYRKFYFDQSTAAMWCVQLTAACGHATAASQNECVRVCECVMVQNFQKSRNDNYPNGWHWV